ncbi:MAG: hypothetical protein P8Z00_11980 [Anaerolineales bacterium]|jgi:hypothetical protein
MKPSYHIAITSEALQERVAPHALQVILAANVRQDNLDGQLRHPEYHFDNNGLAEGQAYLDGQRDLLVQAVKAGEIRSARQAFGRLTHTAQDFYAHSNYVALWLGHQPSASTAQPEDIDPLNPVVLSDPELRSGHVYYPWEALTFVSFLAPLARLLLPHDAHAWMNLDDPRRGPRFAYARAAALRRTIYEFQLINSLLSLEEMQCFTGLTQPQVSIPQQPSDIRSIL